VSDWNANRQKFSVVTHMWRSYVRRVWGANFNGWEGLALPSPPLVLAHGLHAWADCARSIFFALYARQHRAGSSDAVSDWQSYTIRNESVPIQLTQCRFPGLAISSAKIWIYLSDNIYENNFIKQHSGTVMVWNYQNADCSLRKRFIVSFIIIFGALSFPIATWQCHILSH